MSETLKKEYINANEVLIYWLTGQFNQRSNLLNNLIQENWILA